MAIFDTPMSSSEPEPSELVSIAARFSTMFVRWMGSRNCTGLNFTQMELLHILHCQGSAKMSDLAAQLGISARNMTGVVDSLESLGLVSRSAHPQDRRATLIEINSSGCSVVGELMQSEIQGLYAVFDVLSPTERQSLTAMLERLASEMEKRVN